MLVHMIFIGLIIAYCLYWSDAQKVREIAHDATKAHCSNNEVHMLDDYVALTSFELGRDKTGKICMRRRYLFEFSATGYERYHGYCMMSGRRVERIDMEPYRIPLD